MKKLSVLAIVAIFAFSISSSAFAGQTGDSVKGFFKKLFHVPVKTTQNTADTVGATLSNTGEKVLSKTGEDLASGEIPQALVQPVVGAAETTGQTAVDTVQIVPDAVASNPDEAPATS
jgi:hypothetical protein